MGSVTEVCKALVTEGFYSSSHNVRKKHFANLLEILDSSDEELQLGDPHIKALCKYEREMMSFEHNE